MGSLLSGNKFRKEDRIESSVACESLAKRIGDINSNDYIMLDTLLTEHMKLKREHIFILVIVVATLIIIEVAPYLTSQ